MQKVDKNGFTILETFVGIWGQFMKFSLLDVGSFFKISTAHTTQTKVETPLKLVS
jgi:hypothetical protein